MSDFSGWAEPYVEERLKEQQRAKALEDVIRQLHNDAARIEARRLLEEALPFCSAWGLEGNLPDRIEAFLSKEQPK